MPSLTCVYAKCYSANKMLELTEMSTHKKSSERIHAWRWWWISDLEFKYARTHSLALCLARVYSSSHLNSIDYLNRWIKHNWSILVEWASCCILLSCLFIAFNLIRPSKYLCTWMRVRKKRQTNKQSQKNEVKSNKCVLWVTDRHTHRDRERPSGNALTWQYCFMQCATSTEAKNTHKEGERDWE